MLCLPNSLWNIVYPFLDNILSCYRMELMAHETVASFAIVYQISRMLTLLSLMWTESTFFYSAATVVLIITGMLVTLIQPYKSAVYNALDTFLLLSLALGMVGNSAFFTSHVDDPRNTQSAVMMIILPYRSSTSCAIWDMKCVRSRSYHRLWLGRYSLNFSR